MAQAGPDVTSIVQAVRGSATEPKADEQGLSLDILAQRLVQLELTQRSLALENQELRAEKAAAEEGLRAALEELQKLREAEPVEDPAKLVAILEREAVSQHKAKLARWKAEVQGMPKAIVVSHYAEPIPLTINGVTAWIRPGENTVPSAYAEAWARHLEDQQFADTIAHQLSGADQQFGDLEAILDTTRGLGSEVVRAWSEDLGAG